MLTNYIRAAMEKARYEIIEDDGSYYGEIPGFQGVWSNEKTLAACQCELQSVLEDWVLFGLQHADRLPTVSGISLNPRKVAEIKKAA